MILSLFAGSICGTILLILPVFFYRAAYITKPSKKDRSQNMILGYVVVVLSIPIGICGVI